jgi:hypothetical protein
MFSGIRGANFLPGASTQKRKKRPACGALELAGAPEKRRVRPRASVASRPDSSW